MTRSAGWYLVGEEAIDVARVTNLPLMHARRSRQWEQPEIGWHAAETTIAEGHWELQDIILDVGRLEYHQQIRVMLTLIAGHYVADTWPRDPLTPLERGMFARLQRQRPVVEAAVKWAQSPVSHRTTIEEKDLGYFTEQYIDRTEALWS